MANVEELIRYFSDGIEQQPELTLGIEAETHFVQSSCVDTFLATPRSGAMTHSFVRLGKDTKWELHDGYQALSHPDGSEIMYELGSQNVEVAGSPARVRDAVPKLRRHLQALYRACATQGLEPYHFPVLEVGRGTPGVALAVPDERDATWITLDGRDALHLLASAASVQFTFSVSPEEAIPTLNRLNAKRRTLLRCYPQHKLWQRYIVESYASYRKDRYGGPTHFTSLEDYCQQLAKHAVVKRDHLQRFTEVQNLNIPLFLRSVWWHFRLKRYGNTLCIECRPFPRMSDHVIQDQLNEVLSIAGIQV